MEKTPTYDRAMFKRVLGYVRPWNKDYFDYLGKHLFEGAAFETMSDFKGCGSLNLNAEIYRAYAAKDLTRPAYLSEEVIEDIIVRDRLLRSVPPEQARRILFAMAAGMEKIVRTFKPDLLTAISIDSYIVDLVKIVGEEYHVPFYGFVCVLFNGYHLATARGEHNAFREPDEAECKLLIDTLLDKYYKTNYLVKVSNPHAFVFKRWFRELFKLPYFRAKRYLSGDFLNYHYWTSESGVFRNPSPVNLYPARFFDKNWEKKLDGWKGRLFYCPLQYHPEHNTDYWCARSDFFPYPEGLQRAIEAIGNQGLICVKEHPNMLGYRTAAFYRGLKANSNVVLIPPEVPSVSLIERCDATLNWSGSAGIESYLRGKPTMIFGTPYYSKGRYFHNFSSVKDAAQIGIITDSMKASPPLSYSEKIAFARHVLAGCPPGEVMESWFDEKDPIKKKNADDVVRSLKVNLPKWLEWTKRSKSSVRVNRQGEIREIRTDALAP